VTDPEEFADDRDAHRDAAHGEGERDLYADGWHGSVLALEDALIDPDLLDRVVPLDGRWPEPRLLDRTDVFYLRDRTRLHPRGFDAETAAWLLYELHVDLPDWHAAAVFDEEATTGSLARAALAALGVPTVRDLDPRAWLESTVLVRFLAGRAGGGFTP